MGKTKEKTWMLIIETKSYRGLSCYRKVCADFKDGEYTEYYDQVVVDTGIEWQIWDIVKLPE